MLKLVAGTALIIVAFAWADPPQTERMCRSKLEAMAVPGCPMPNQQGLMAARIKRAIAKLQEPPIIFVGDSITALAPLPEAINGVPVVNAGIGGADTSIDFPSIIAGRFMARLIVVALGTNDVAYPNPEGFADRYSHLLARLQPLTDRMVLVSVPTRATYDVTAVNEIIRAQGLPVVTLGELEKTGDGIHLTAAAYEQWTKAILGGAS